MSKRDLLLTCLKFINDLRVNNALDEIEIGNTSCRNCLDKISLFWEKYEEFFGKDFDIYAEIKKLQRIDYTPNFSEREKEFARLLCLPDSEVAKRLIVAPSTVKSHYTNFRNKTGTSSKTSSLIELIKAGVIDINEVETR